MALSDIQLRVERSIYEAIRLKLVAEGLLPDRSTFPNTPTGTAGYDTALAAIEQAQGFAAEVFGHSSSLAKGNKKTARIAIIPRRIMPGDIGTNINGGFAPNPTNPDANIKTIPALFSSNFHLDINIASGAAREDRALHGILAQALSTWSFIPMYDDPTETFFIKQFNFYDLPDVKNGIEEKVYSYEVPDIYMYEGKTFSNIPLINQITVKTSVKELHTILTRTGQIIGPFEGNEGIFMDLSGLSYSIINPMTDEGDNTITTENNQNILI